MIDWSAVDLNTVNLSKLSEDGKKDFVSWYKAEQDKAKQIRYKELSIQRNNRKSTKMNTDPEFRHRISSNISKGNAGKKHTFKDKEAWRESISASLKSKKEDKDVI